MIAEAVTNTKNKNTKLPRMLINKAKNVFEIFSFFSSVIMSSF